MSKTQISKIIQSRDFLGALLSKIAGPLMKVAVSMAKNILTQLGITTAASAIDAGIQKKILDSGTTTLIIPNQEMNDIMKIVQALEDSGILLKGITKAIEKKTKEQKEGFLGMLLGTFAASLLGNMLAGKGIVRAGYVNKGQGKVRAGYSSKEFYPLTNFEIQRNYQNEPRFSAVYSRDNLPKKIKDGGYVINLDEYTDVGTPWIALYILDNYATYFDSFGVEHVPKEIKRFIGNKKMQTNIFRIQAHDSVMWGYFWIEFINYMFAGKTLINYTSVLSPHDLKK